MRTASSIFCALALTGLALVVPRSARADVVQMTVYGNQPAGGSDYQFQPPDAPTGTWPSTLWMNPYAINVAGNEALAMSCDDYNGSLTQGNGPTESGPPWFSNSASFQTLYDGGFAPWNGTTGVKFQGSQTYAGYGGDGTTEYTILEQYAAAAIIANQVFQAYNWGGTGAIPNYTPNFAVTMTYAEWGVFNPASTFTDPVYPVSGASWNAELPEGGDTVIDAAENEMMSVLNYVAFTLDSGGVVSVPNVTVYTPCGPGDAGGCYFDPNNPDVTGVNSGQELIGPGTLGTVEVKIEGTPEASSLTFLAFEWFALAGGLLLLRRWIKAHKAST